METERAEQEGLAVGLLGLFSPLLRYSALEDKAFRDQLGLSVDATITLDQIGVTFQRSALFGAVRALFAGHAGSLEIHYRQGRLSTISIDAAEGRIFIQHDGQKAFITQFGCLHADSAKRLTWLDQEASAYQVNDSHIDQWRAILATRVADDEEVDQVFAEFQLTPVFVARALRKVLRKGTVKASDLVPIDPRYYDRLIGESSNGPGLSEHFDASVAPRIRALVAPGTIRGLKEALLYSSHPWGAKAISLNSLPRQELLDFYQWLEFNGDRLSQLGGIECGLAHLSSIPELEPAIARLVKLIVADRPEDQDGRLNLVCSLISLVDGELARTGIFRRRVPFWRRLAAIAHAAVLERTIMEAQIPVAEIAAWARQNGWHLYCMQTFVDMRTEPRWIPDFLLPEQLYAEFIGRITGAAQPNLPEIKSTELRELLEGSGPESVRSKLQLPFAFLPGPLEGGVEATTQIPPDIEEMLRADLQKPELSAKSFIGLVNCAFIFRIAPSLTGLAADALRRAKHQLRRIETQDEAFALLSGLATAASVTRSADLAQELRILMRVVRRRPGVEISQDNALRILLVAAAASADLAAWCKYVGECITELAFEEMTKVEAQRLLLYTRLLVQFEPQLCATTARADAAMSALVGVDA